MAITFGFCMGNLEEILEPPTGHPFLQVFYNATQTARGATVMGSFVVGMTVLANLTTVAAASRQLWTFSRDQALPFSSWFSSKWDGNFLKHDMTGGGIADVKLQQESSLGSSYR